MKACFNGCSFTEGLGFEPNQRDNYIYDRLVCNYFNWQRENIAVEGSSNQTIFLRSAESIMSGEHDIVFTQWSALNRQWFYPGPDCEYSVNNLDQHLEFSYRDIHLDKKFNRRFKETIRLFNDDYYKIIELIKLANILVELGKTTNTLVVHINGLLHWTNDLVCPLDTNNLTNCLSTYTKNILDFENRSDEEILKFFLHLQQEFAKLNQSAWVNLFDGFQQNTQDKGIQGHHPGIKSHKWMADKIINYMDQL